tara:strand:- start:392 stop:607 length:216 start_codon:yes stop_codon:yes gene_type:complete
MNYIETQRKKDAEKALIEQDAQWESVHGTKRDEHQRFLLAPYVDFESNAEFAQFVRMNELRMKAKKTEEEE